METYTTAKLEDGFNITKNFLKNNSPKRPASLTPSEETQEEIPEDDPTGEDPRPTKRARVEVIRMETLSPATSSMQSDGSYLPSEFSQDLFVNPPSPSEFINVEN